MCNVSVSKSFVLPVSYGTRTYKEYEEVEASYTVDEAKEILARRLSDFIENKKKENILIQNSFDDYIESGSKVEIDTEFSVKQKVGTMRQIQEAEWRLELTDGIDGDDN